MSMTDGEKIRAAFARILEASPGAPMVELSGSERQNSVKGLLAASALIAGLTVAAGAGVLAARNGDRGTAGELTSSTGPVSSGAPSPSPSTSPDTSTVAAASTYFDLPPPLVVAPLERSEIERGHLALVHGVVVYEAETGCFYLDDTPVVWPAGTTAQEDVPGVVLSDGTLVSVGDLVDGDGGYFLQFEPEYPPQCQRSRLGIAIFNSTASITVTTPDD